VVALLAFPVVLNSFAQVEQSITLATNKDSYLPGDIVQLSGVVTGQPNVLVALQIKDSSGNLILIRTIQSDQNGNFAIKFKIPPTATSGNFNIAASAKINGFIVTQTKTMSATVPEFGTVAPIILVISILSIIILSARTRLLRST
jgi:predicted secreted protein with PEFG-CTERM motif